MELIPEQGLRPEQRPIIASEVQESLEILSLPLMELRTRLLRSLGENCFLEEDAPDQTEELEWLDSGMDGEAQPYHGDYAAEIDGAWPEELAQPGPSLQEHLLSQLHRATSCKRSQSIGEFLIGSLDEDGYLRASLSECAAMLGATREEIEEVLRLIQGFDPPGVGARDLRECLLLQLAAEEEAEVRLRELAIAVVSAHLPDLAHGKQEKIAAALKRPSSEVHEAVQLILGLDPRPGRNFGRPSPYPPPPDVIVKKAGREYLIAVNEAPLPRLRINPYYLGFLTGEREADPGTMAFLRGQYRAASLLLRSLERRRLTLGRIAEVLIELERPFLEKGLAYLRPLTIKEIAGRIERHESTVSRALSGKYIETPRGLFTFRFFFGPKLEGGRVLAPAAIKDAIREILARADPENRMSDERLTALLRARGIEIARRTVAKYRKELAIPSSRTR